MKYFLKWWKRRSLWFKITLIGTSILIVLIRVFAPTYIKYNVLAKLNKIEGFNTFIADVNLTFFSPTIIFYNVKIYSNQTPNEIPLFKADQIIGELMLSSIDEGKLLTHSTIVNPVLTFLQFNDTIKETGEIIATSNYKKADNVNWSEEIAKLFALTINEFDIENGAIYFLNKKYGQDICLKSDSIYACVLNIANSEHKKEALFSTGKLSARLMDHAPLVVDLLMAPNDTNTAIDITFSLVRLDITTLNRFWRSYVNLNVEKGHFTMKSNISIRNDRIKGRLRPYSDDFDIFYLNYDENQGLKNMTWQALVSLATKILLLGDKDEDKICKIDFEGTSKHLNFKLRKNSEELLSKMFVKAVNSKLKNHTIEFVKIE